MKSFLLSFLGFFCVVFMSAQEISEDQFISQLEAKQKKLSELIDQKGKLDIDIAIAEKNIKKLTDETKKKDAEKIKNDLEKQLSDLTNEIGRGVV